MKRLLLIMLLCFVVGSALAETDLVEVKDYTIPEINLNDKPEDYKGIWKCVYAYMSGKIYTYESLIAYLAERGMTVEYNGKTYSYSDFSYDDFLVIEDDKVFDFNGAMQTEQPFEYTKETDANHSGSFMLNDGHIIVQNLEADVKLIFEKWTTADLVNYYMNSKNTNDKGVHDFSSMNYQQLVELNNQINLAIFNCEEWQEVMVPEGIYVVGKDIPAGHWTVTAPSKIYSVSISIGPDLLDNGRVNYDNYYALYGKDYSLNQGTDGKTNFISVELKNGQYISIESASAIFTPFAGYSFSFK